jgi:hypothetical protein
MYRCAVVKNLYTKAVVIYIQMRKPEQAAVVPKLYNGMTVETIVQWRMNSLPIV